MGRSPLQPPEIKAVARAMRAFGPITDSDLHAVADFTSVVHLSAGEYLLRAGERATLGALVLNGALREYWVLRDGSERTKDFAIEGDLAGSFADLLSDSPSRSFVQAETDAKLLVASWADFDALCAARPAWNQVARGLAEWLFMKKCEREWQLLALDASARYEAFLSLWPGLESRVPQVHVASYLAITPEHLSRIRRRRVQGARSSDKRPVHTAS